jgi:hypothetical protein
MFLLFSGFQPRTTQLIIPFVLGLFSRYGHVRREPPTRAPSAHQGLPVRHQMAATLVGHLSVVRGLCGSLLPIRVSGEAERADYKLQLI